MPDVDQCRDARTGGAAQFENNQEPAARTQSAQRHERGRPDTRRKGHHSVGQHAGGGLRQGGGVCNAVEPCENREAIQLTPCPGGNSGARMPRIEK